MTESTDAATRETYEGAIRSFTEAEIALREIVTAVQRYRSASDAVVEAGATLSASRESLLATLTTLEATASEMQRLSLSLSQASAVIAALDPERFWASFTKLEAAARSSSELVVQSLAASTSRLEGVVAESSQVLRDQIADAAAELTASASATTDHLQGKIDTAVAGLTATHRASTDEVSLAVSYVRGIATVARDASVASMVLGITAIVMVAFLLLR